MRVLCLTAVGLAVAAGPALAEPVDGVFTASGQCPAFQSMRRGTNPGDVQTEPGRDYEALEFNAARGFFRVRIPGAPVLAERWVSGDCGTHVAAGETAPDDDKGKEPAETAMSTDNLLVVSWQSAFCERRPRTAECRLLNAGDLPDVALQLSIHGLWPQPNGTFYCGAEGRAHEDTDRARRWADLPSLDLTPETRAALDALMPGALSHLDRHEWIKHGTCYSADEEEYFLETIRLMEALNASPVAALLSESIGRAVEASAIRDAFDEAFGEGAGERVEVDCARDDDSGRTLIAELRIALEGDITSDSRLADLILAAEPGPRGCSRGIVDPAGLQD